jgi:S1-C subfamily serine protease
VAFSADGAFLAASVGYPGTGGIYVYNSTPAPVLSLAPSDGNATISWVIPSASFALQQSSDLSNWTEVTNQPALNLSNLQNQLALPASDNRQFYRLKNQ